MPTIRRCSTGGEADLRRRRRAVLRLALSAVLLRGRIPRSRRCPTRLALAVWLAASFAAYLAAHGAILPRPARSLLIASAFPAVFINLGHGQNGFLTAGCSAARCACSIAGRARGVLIGLLAYKPQFGVVIPIALLADARRTIAAPAPPWSRCSRVSFVGAGGDVWHASLTR